MEHHLECLKHNEMSLKNILKWIFAPPKSKTYITPVPPLSPELVKKLDKAAFEENSFLRAENIRLKAALDKQAKKRIKEQKREAEEISKELEEERKELKSLEKEKAVDFILKGIGKLPKFALKRNKTLGYFKGVRLKETDEGYYGFYPLIKWGARVFSLRTYSTTFSGIFKDPTNIASQLKSGRIDTNFDFDTKGNPILVEPDIKETEDNDKVRIIDLSSQERQKYERRIEELLNDIKKYAYISGELKNREVDYIREISDLKTDKNVAVKERDITASRTATLVERQTGMVEAITDSIASIQDATTAEVLGAKQNQKLRDAIDDLQTIIGKILSTTVEDRAREKIEQAMETLANIAEKVKPKEVLIKGMPATKEEPKPKKGEK